MTSPTERAAIHSDAQRHANELRAVAKALWPDREDPAVRAELTTVLSELKQAEQVLADVRPAYERGGPSNL